MDLHLFAIVRAVVALGAGSLIGLGFGLLQRAAQRKNEQLEATGRLKSGWSLMPGSGARVAYLLVTLALIQLVCPILFVEGTQWWVSGGLLLGYGWMLLQQLLRRRAAMA